MLRIARTLHDEVIAHCRSCYPKEACGLLAGQREQVTRIYPMTNLEDSPIGYAMDPREQLRVESAMRRQGERCLGIYHSHTASDAYPSPVDIELAVSPDVSYVLVSLKDRERPVVQSFRIDGARVTPEPHTVQ